MGAFRREIAGNFFLLTTFASIGLWAVAAGGPASAAELALLKARPPVMTDNWTGFYAGGHGGYGWGRKIFIDNFPVFDGELDADVRARGGLFGLHLGYNYQADWLVLGIESDFSWSGIKNNGFSCFGFGNQLCSAQAEWIASIAGRVGITSGPALIYIKGGPAWTHDRFTNVATCSGPQPTRSGGISAACGDLFIANQTRSGWMIGAGVEAFFAQNWSVKLEYNYIDFGARSVPFDDGATGFFTEEIHQKINLVKAGINYHFDWAGVATAAPARGLIVKAKPRDDTSNHVSAFSSFDVSKNSYGAVIGALIAPYKDIDTSGLRVMMSGEAGAYKYPVDGASIRGVYTGGNLLAGYGFEGDNYAINLLAGANAVNHMLSAVDTENSVQGTAFGVKARGDVWVNPTPQTMAYGEAEYSTAFKTYYTKAKVGYDITKSMQIFVGPEVSISGDQRSRQWRAGAHVTQMQFRRIQVDLSAGYANDRTVGTGAYGTIEFSTNF